MPTPVAMRERLLDKVRKTEPRWWEINRHLFDHPELSNEEVESSKLLASVAEREGFKISFGQAGLATAFRAEVKGSSPGPTVAFLAEYDALPGIGHGCGHNFIGTCGTFAALAFADIMRDLPGRVVLLGTPAEETFGGKIKMLDEGEFDDVDFALMIHPSIETTGHYKSVACFPLEIEFHGKTAHASAAPWKGINALDALIQTFVAVDGLKRQLRPTVRVPGIITYGGDRANIIPDRAVGQWSLRAESVEELHTVVEKVLNCARGAALATGATMEWRQDGTIYEDIVTNATMADRFNEHWTSVGGILEPVPDRGRGSLDIGNVSRRLPCIHAAIRTASPDIAGHTVEFGQSTLTDFGRDQLRRAISSLALTGLDLLCDPEFFNATRAEFQQRFPVV